MKVKLDGQQKEFTTGVSAIRSNLGLGLWSMIVSGASTNESFVINLWSDGDNFGTGQNFELAALGGTTENSLNFMSPLGSADATSIWTSVSVGADATPELHCTITDANDKFMKGTFSGKLYRESDGALMQATEGEFYIKY